MEANEFYLVWRLKTREYQDCEWEILIVTQDLQDVAEVIEGTDCPTILVERYNFEYPNMKF